MQQNELLELDITEVKEIATKAGVKFAGNISKKKLVDAILALPDVNAPTTLSIEAAKERFPNASDTDATGADIHKPIADETAVEEEDQIEGAIMDAPAEPEPAAGIQQPVYAKQTFNPNPNAATASQYPTQAEIEAALAGHFRRGLHMSFNAQDNQWLMEIGRKQAAGTLSMPLKTIIFEANKMFTPTAAPTEGLPIDEIAKLKVPRK